MDTLRIGTITLRSNLILAPMAGITDCCVRMIAQRHEAGLVCTEMISASGLIRKSPATYRYLQRHPAEGHVSVQIVGADPAELAEAAKIVEDHGASLVDLNLGCPVKKVCSTGAGAALLVDPPRVRRIFQAVRKAISCPLTAKIRAGWDEHTLTASEIARIAEEHGVDALTLHARTKTQGFRGLADWDMVLRLKEERRIPIIGNGDVFHPHRAKEVLTRTRCNGIMIGRGARGNPWIFSQTQAYLASGVPTGLPSHNERMHTMLSHLESALLWYGTETGMKRMRQHLAWYVKGLPLANWFRRELHRNADAPSIRSLIEKYFDTLETMHPSACPGGVHPL